GEDIYFFPPFAGAFPPFASAPFAGSAPFAAGFAPPFAAGSAFAGSAPLCPPLWSPPFAASAPFAAGSAAATSASTLTGAAILSPAIFGATTTLPLTLMVCTLRWEGVGSLWAPFLIAAFIFSRYWAVE